MRNKHHLKHLAVGLHILIVEVAAVPIAEMEGLASNVVPQSVHNVIKVTSLLLLLFGLLR